MNKRGVVDPASNVNVGQPQQNVPRSTTHLIVMAFVIAFAIIALFAVLLALKFISFEDGRLVLGGSKGLDLKEAYINGEFVTVLVGKGSTHENITGIEFTFEKGGESATVRRGVVFGGTGEETFIFTSVDLIDVTSYNRVSVAPIYPTVTVTDEGESVGEVVGKVEDTKKIASSPPSSGSGGSSSDNTVSNDSEETEEVVSEPNQLLFDGIDDLVLVEDDDSLDIVDEITIEMWIKPQYPLRDFFSKTNHDIMRFILGETTDSVKVGYNIGGSFTPTIGFSNSLTENRWNHVAFTYDGSEARVYMDGQLSGTPVSVSGDLKVSNNPLKMGSWALEGVDERFYKGIIRDVKIWNRSLSASEVFDTASKIDIGNNSLVSYWKLDEGEGQIVYDSFGNNHGTLGNDNSSEDSDPVWVVGTEPSLYEEVDFQKPDPSCDSSWNTDSDPPAWLSDFDTTLHVNNNHGSASDLNPGTEALPLLTIKKATELAVANKASDIGTRILVHPGTYRESMNVTMHGIDSEAPIILEATDKCQAILSGSDLWNSGWSSYNSNIYTHSWPYDWGPDDVPANWPVSLNIQEIVLRSEMVFVDGDLLTQVLDVDDMFTGTYYVDESNDLLYVWPQSGITFSSVDKEVAVRNRLLNFVRGNHIAVIGLLIQHGANEFYGEYANSFRIDGSDQIYVKDVTAILNNRGGLGLSSDTNFEGRNNVFNFNGHSGMGAFKVYNLLSVSEEMSYNNWRGELGGYKVWTPAGQKALLMRNATYIDYVAVGNDARGFWLDSDNQNITIEGAYFCNNDRDGLFIEANQGPITVTGSTICNNSGGGILIAASENVLIQDNDVYANDPFQIGLVNDEDRDVDDHLENITENLQVVNLTILNNRIVGYDSSDLLTKFYNWSFFFSSLTSDNNLWYNYETEDAFKIQDLSPSWYLDFDGWESFTGQDANSFWVSNEF